jgi:hypothetical protein
LSHPFKNALLGYNHLYFICFSLFTNSAKWPKKGDNSFKNSPFCIQKRTLEPIALHGFSLFVPWNIFTLGPPLALYAVSMEKGTKIASLLVAADTHCYKSL